MSKISNVLTMIEYLSTGRKYSISELSKKLEVSPRMIRVYKDEIEKAGIYIDTIKGPYGGYVLNQNVNDLEELRNILIEYYSKNRDKITSRTINPYNLILLGNEWGVAAYCELKDEIRYFYINRIKSIEILDNFYN